MEKPAHTEGQIVTCPCGKPVALDDKGKGVCECGEVVAVEPKRKEGTK